MTHLHVDIRKSYPAGPDSAGFDLSVAFNAGDGVTVLFGPSGAGKTLTLESIAGFIRPDSGSVQLNGEALFDSFAGVDQPARRRRCGYVFQKDALFPHMTVRENLRFAAAGLAPGEREERISSILADFRLTQLGGRRPHEISGGERQRATIARTLIARPRLLLLDEPARGLDISLRRELYAILRRVRLDYGLRMLLVTHDLEEAFELGDHMLVSHRGRIVQQGAPQEIYQQPSSTNVARLLGMPNVFEGRVVGSDPDNNTTRLAGPGFEVVTSHLPKRTRGETLDFAIRADRVIVRPHNGSTRAGRLVLPLSPCRKGHWNKCGSSSAAR